jgi:hypothetical protein
MRTLRDRRQTSALCFVFGGVVEKKMSRTFNSIFGFINRPSQSLSDPNWPTAGISPAIRPQYRLSAASAERAAPARWLTRRIHGYTRHAHGRYPRRRLPDRLVERYRGNAITPYIAFVPASRRVVTGGADEKRVYQEQSSNAAQRYINNAGSEKELGNANPL